MSQNVIELNGKRYDAKTGELLGAGKAHSTVTPVGGRVVDGFFRRPGAKQPKPRHPAQAGPSETVKEIVAKAAPVSTPAPAKTAATQPAAPQQPRSIPTAVQHHAGHTHVHKPGKHVRHHQPQHSKTLKRSVVRKPDVRMKPAIKPQAPAEIAAKPASALAPKRSAAQVDPVRLERARATAKHAAVRRFHPHHYGAASVHHTVEPVASHTHVPVIPVRTHPPRQHHVQPATPARPADIFETAMRNAQSHEQPMHKRPRHHRRRLVNITAGVAVFLILGGFVTYLNVPNIQLRIASIEAGFHARMPGYQPTGYALQGGVKQEGGTVVMRFASGDSSYQLSQQSSSWNSQALLDNTLGLSGSYKTIERAGRTIYIYGDGANASWVTGNVRYDITGNASLSPDELANIAASM